MQTQETSENILHLSPTLLVQLEPSSQQVPVISSRHQLKVECSHLQIIHSLT